MPKRNVIIAPVVRIAPAVTKRGVEMLREAPPGGFSIEFQDKQAAKLFPDERSAGILEVLEGLRKLGAPAYIEFHPDTKAITRILIPLISKISVVSGAKGENIRVELEMSSARHILTKETPDFEDILKTLRAAEQSKTVMLITETDKHEIIDVRVLPPDFKPPTPPLPKEIPTLKKEVKWWWPFGCSNSISSAQAITMFNMVAATSCDPLTVPSPCIPFLYPDDGCWGRAHEMYRLILAAGVTSRKIWIYGSLVTNTRNNPACVVYWGWHVASTVCVRGLGIFGWFFRSRKVIDPSLFTGPVSEATWKSVQGDPSATLVGSDGTIFYRNSTGSYILTDPTYTQTNTVLATYRLQLQVRSLTVGPPPYAACP